MDVTKESWALLGIVLFGIATAIGGWLFARKIRAKQAKLVHAKWLILAPRFGVYVVAALYTVSLVSTTKGKLAAAIALISVLPAYYGVLTYTRESSSWRRASWPLRIAWFLSILLTVLGLAGMIAWG